MSAIGGGMPSATTKRVMAFIDGKNLALRYAEIKKSRTPLPGVIEKKDTFVWNPGVGVSYPYTLSPGYISFEILRANYYTYFQGDVPGLDALNGEIKQIQFSNDGNIKLFPNILKKDSSQVHSKGDDIALTVDALRDAYKHNMEIAHIFTGDGDYVPLIREIRHQGLMVCVSAFSSGFNPSLEQESDYFSLLDDFFFQPS